ncbi:MAG: transposase [Desulfobacterales bacterium]
MKIWFKNFIATSNHIHLIVSDSTKNDSIPRTKQFVAGRLGQEYNRRKKRKGTFWEDRYHAIAVSSDFAGLRANANRIHPGIAKIIHSDFPRFQPSTEIASC